MSMVGNSLSIEGKFLLILGWTFFHTIFLWKMRVTVYGKEDQI